MIGQTQLGLEGLNVFEDVMHGGKVARYSVQVNARNNVSALNAIACNKLPMENGWFARLVEVIKADKRSALKLSVDAGLGRNYVQQMIKLESEPGSERLARLLDQLGKSNALYVYTGLRLNEEDFEMLRLASSLSPARRRAAIQLFSEFAAPSGDEEQADDPSQVSAARG